MPFANLLNESGKILPSLTNACFFHEKDCATCSIKEQTCPKPASKRPSVYQFATLELTKSREWLNLDAANAPLGDNLATPVAPSQWDLVLSTPDDVWSHEFFEFFYFKLDFLHSSSSLPYLCTLAK